MPTAYALKERAFQMIDCTTKEKKHRHFSNEIAASDSYTLRIQWFEHYQALSLTITSSMKRFKRCRIQRTIVVTCEHISTHTFLHQQY